MAQTNKEVFDLNDIKIPPIPSVMLKVLRFDENITAGSQELEQIIAPDKAISLDILRISNSSFYGRSGSIKTLKDAITLLGMKTVKNLVILQSKKQFTNTLTSPSLKQYIIELPILSSLVSFDLTNPLGLKQLREEIFTFSLFRKIGSSILAMNFPKKYQEVLRMAEAGTKSIIEFEREEFTLDSIEVGMRVFKQWNMPRQFHDIMQNQNFGIGELETVSDYDRITRVADIISRRLVRLIIPAAEEELELKIYDFHKVGRDIKDLFAEDYYENIKEHPYFL
jgi:HD-like signal output (HDOD) protein